MCSLLLPACIARFLAWSESTLAPKTTELYGSYLRRFERWAGPVDVRTVTPALLTSWSRKHHPTQSVRRLLSWLAREERSIQSNPLEGMRKPRQGRRRRVLSWVESARMLRRSDGCFRRLLIALRESIMRPQEARAVRWDEISLPDGRPADSAQICAGMACWRVAGAKGFNRRADQDEERTIPISPRLGRLLLRSTIVERNAGGVIFRNSRGHPWTANAVRCRMRRLRVRAGLVADHRGERIVAYSLRHTSATRYIADGGKPYLLRVIMGHARFRTTERYLHVQPVDAVAELGRVFRPKPGRK